jgi:hypothetical protein
MSSTGELIDRKRSRSVWRGADGIGRSRFSARTYELRHKPIPRQPPTLRMSGSTSGVWKRSMIIRRCHRATPRLYFPDPERGRSWFPVASTAPSPPPAPSAGRDPTSPSPPSAARRAGRAAATRRRMPAAVRPARLALRHRRAGRRKLKGRAGRATARHPRAATSSPNRAGIWAERGTP